MSLPQTVPPTTAACSSAQVWFSKWLRQPFTRALLVITLLGMVLRVATVWWIPSQPVSDFWSYYARALNIYKYGHYEAFAGLPNARQFGRTSR